MTGLDLGADALVEVAAVVAPPVEAVDQMSDFVRTMHTTSGLLTALSAGTSLADAQAQVLDYIRTWVPDPGKAPLAGNSVGTDKAFLDRDMPELVAHLHY